MDESANPNFMKSTLFDDSPTCLPFFLEALAYLTKNSGEQLQTSSPWLFFIKKLSHREKCTLFEENTRIDSRAAIPIWCQTIFTMQSIMKSHGYFLASYCNYSSGFRSELRVGKRHPSMGTELGINGSTDGAQSPFESRSARRWTWYLV